MKNSRTKSKTVRQSNNKRSQKKSQYCKCDFRFHYETELAKDEGKCQNAPRMRLNLQLARSTNDYRCVLHCAAKQDFKKAKILKSKKSADLIKSGKIGAECNGDDGSTPEKKKICCCKGHVFVQGHQFGVSSVSTARYLYSSSCPKLTLSM